MTATGGWHKWVLGLACRPCETLGQHSADAFPMVDSSRKAEIPLRRSDIDRPSLNARARGVNHELHRLSRLGRGFGEILQRDLFGIGDEIEKLAAPDREASSNGGVRGIVDINIGPIGRRLDRCRLALRRRRYDIVHDKSRAPARPIDAGKAQRTETVSYTNLT